MSGMEEDELVIVARVRGRMKEWKETDIRING